MKRSCPLTRRSSLATRTPLRRSCKRIAPMSAKRRREQPARKACRAAVLERDPLCRRCGVAPSTEVHELHRGAGRHADYLDPEQCRGVCHDCHVWITEHPSAAIAEGLAKRGWDR